MDAGQLLQLLVLLAVVSAVGQVAIGAAGRASDGIANLFVPPNRALGWPRGVQESDEPWGWRTPPVSTAEPPIDDGGDGDPPDEAGPWSEPRRGGLLVPIGRVRPVRLVVRPH